MTTAAPTVDPNVLAVRLADAEGRLARLEAKATGADLDDDAMQVERAARFCGYSVSNFRRLARIDPDLARTYHKGPGRNARLVFSRVALERWKAARR